MWNDYNRWTMEAYEDALEYLYRFTDFSLERKLRYAPERFDLQRMRDFLAQIGLPQAAFPIIHIAGTKGKGSVAAFCAAMLQAGGYRVGLYTSPHLHEYTERIQINGEAIPKAAFVRLVDELRPFLADDSALTTFEITTALALLYFQQQGATAAVLEVGLGGRLDATNVIEPLASVITPISYDHTEFLGNTLAQIAAEKAGIIKPNTPVIVGPQAPEAQEVIVRIAAEREAPCLLVEQFYNWELVNRDLSGQTFRVWPRPDAPWQTFEWAPPAARELRVPLLGRHQMENAVTAFAALQTAHNLGLALAEGAYEHGLARVHWPGRFEILAAAPTLVVDAAHNVDSARRLVAALDDVFPGAPTTLLFGASSDKDLAGMLAELLPRMQRVIFTQSDHPRAVTAADLAAYAPDFDGQVLAVESPALALEAAVRAAPPEAVILATGSLFLAAEIRRAWRERQVAALDK